MKKIFLIGFSVLLVILGYTSFFRESETPSVEIPESTPVPVTTESAGNRKRVVDRLSFSGTVRAEGTADIVSRVAGSVVTADFPIGSRVAEGTILTRIDERSGSGAEEYAGFRSEDVREAGRAVERAKKTYHEAKRADEREKSNASELAKDLARMTLESAESTLRSVVDAHIVRSPLGGTVISKNVSAGDTVAAGTALFTVEKAGAKRIVSFFVNGNDRALLRPGMPVMVSTDPSASETYNGRLLRVATAADDDNRRFLAEAEIDGPSASGTVASVSVDVLRIAPDGHIILPLQTIVFGQDSEAIHVVENGHAKRIPISVIRIDGEGAEISAPIADDVEIIFENAKRVKDGGAVSVTDNRSL